MKIKHTTPWKVPNFGWTCDVYIGERSTVENDICQVWGNTYEQTKQRAEIIIKAFSKAKNIIKEFDYE